ncbi:B-cell receptor CD22-like isoform X2 [Pristis pectinata]|uniref:B-cell receptor CD22-like isoform X2 n=1 Tax=Pristis pectinata TaxID=685728 RepID=UPI00223D5026|nr:B-cell receptor CD22-like isoform X2 [Pristis pectinata]
MTAALLLLLTISQGVHCGAWEVRTPKTVTASEGSCVRIPCTFDHPARSPLSEVMWLKDNKTHGSLVIDSKGLSNSSFLHRTQLHPGWEVEKDCTLTVDGLTHGDVGRYYFRIKTKDGEKYSGPDGVLVNISDVSNLPRISSAEEMVEGKEVELTCSVKYACPGHLRWNGSDGLDRLLETAGTVQNEGRNSLTLRFVASHQDHGRTLRCVQTSSQGKPLVQSITLNVKYAPRFVHLTLSPFKPINRGDSVTLRCGVGDSNPPVTRYRWHQSGLGTTQSREVSMATHRVNNVYGYWEHWCEATNSVGTATSEKTKLPVYDSYSWAVWTPLSLRAREGSCVIIPCRFRIRGSGSGDSTATGIWLKSDHYHGARVYHTSARSGGDYAGRVEFLGNMAGGNCSLKIRDLRASDSDKYYFRIEASAGKWSDPIGFKLLVSGDLQKPVITVPERVVDGEGASLTCSVYSYCPEDTPVFEWHLPHLSRPQETGTVFKDDQWIYSSTVVYVPTFGTTQPAVKCTANFGPGTPSAETEVSLDVKYPPRNVTISLTVNWGTDTHSMKERDRVVLSCDCITAHPAVREYTWFRDGTEVRGERSSSLQFPSIFYKDYGKYACQASNEVGKSRSAELTVMGKYQPQDVHVEYRVNGVRSETTDVKENDRLNLTCVSTRSDPPVSGYSWHRGGWQMSQEQVLQIERITQQHHGNSYHCLAQNAIGTGRSETFTINVQYAPTDVRITFFGAAVVGKYITLSCTSVANPAATHYSWKKVCDSQPTDLWTNSQDYLLRVTRAVASCDYYCKAKNSVGERESPPQRIDVQYAPTDVRITSPQAAAVGEHITLLCDSDANPAPAYSWRNVCGSRSTNLWRYSQDYQLWVSQADTSCVYYCKAKNSVGERESPPQRIDVQYAPTNVRIISPRAAVVVGEHITLSCESDATPAPAYSWRKVCGSRSTDLGGNGIKYQFHVKVEDASCNYHCRARNSIGEGESPPHHIDVQYKPMDVKIQSVDSVVEGAQATLQCQSAANPPAKTYLWKKVCSGREERLEGTTSELQIQFSSGDESCDYYCRARNGIGDQDSGPKRFNVQWSYRKKVAIGLTPVIIVIILILIVAGILYYRRKKRQDSLSHWSTDATNVVYSVVNKPKPRERTVYENMVLTENAHGQSAPEESIHASVSFHHGPNRKRSAPHTDTAWTAGSRDPDIKIRGEPGVVYSQVCVQPRPTKTQTSDDYENIGHLCARADDESDEEISYTTVVLPPPSKPSLLRRPSEDSIEYTNLRR